MTEEEFRDVMREECKRHGGASAWAAALGVTPAFVSLALAGKRRPGRVILEAMGYERIDGETTYRRVDV
jgi:hypothetical protein